MASVILFDVNETLLDIGALDSFFQRLFHSDKMRSRWFKELESLWLVTIATRQYKDFSRLAEAALQMTADKEGVELREEDRVELLERMTMLPAHRDATPALMRLKAKGLRLAALTNGTLTAARAQLKHAELDHYFEQILSVDEVQKYKPAPEPYHMAVERLGVTAGDVCMVAAHAWDIAGAHAAGLKTAFVARPRKVLNPLGPSPDLNVDDLMELTERILRGDL